MTEVLIYKQFSLGYLLDHLLDMLPVRILVYTEFTFTFLFIKTVIDVFKTLHGILMSPESPNALTEEQKNSFIEEEDLCLTSVQNLILNTLTTLMASRCI